MSMAQRWIDDHLATVCIDQYDDSVLRGRLYHRSVDGGRVFRSTIQLLMEMERILDVSDHPKSYTARRTFAAPPEQTAAPPCETVCSGEKATFFLKVLFRQNAGWQGSVTWLEGGQEQSFRSVLELLGLLDSALSETAKAS